MSLDLSQYSKQELINIKDEAQRLIDIDIKKEKEKETNKELNALQGKIFLLRSKSTPLTQYFKILGMNERGDFVAVMLTHDPSVGLKDVNYSETCFELTIASESQGWWKDKIEYAKQCEQEIELTEVEAIPSSFINLTTRLLESLLETPVEHPNLRDLVQLY